MSPPKRRGHLKIYLGYAAGVGKTYRMLEDARDLKSHDIDVVLAFLEPQGRADLIERARNSKLFRSNASRAGAATPRNST